MTDADYNIGFFDKRTNVYIKEFGGVAFIFKDFAAFENQSADVCYIPESDEAYYTYADFIQIAKENKNLAEYLFETVDWQRPETVFDELICRDIIGKDGKFTPAYAENFNCFPQLLSLF